MPVSSPGLGQQREVLGEGDALPRAPGLHEGLLTGQLGGDGQMVLN